MCEPPGLPWMIVSVFISNDVIFTGGILYAARGTPGFSFVVVARIVLVSLTFTVPFATASSAFVSVVCFYASQYIYLSILPYYLVHGLLCVRRLPGDRPQAAGVSFSATSPFTTLFAYLGGVQVDKHTLKCRSCWVLTCVDCSKDFKGEEYRTHTSCISEAEKYQGNTFVQPAKVRFPGDQSINRDFQGECLTLHARHHRERRARRMFGQSASKPRWQRPLSRPQ